MNSDSWEPPLLFLANNDYCYIAHDRPSHERSSQTWPSNDKNTYADDLAARITTIDLKVVVMVYFSAGDGEIARYINCHSTNR